MKIVLHQTCSKNPEKPEKTRKWTPRQNLKLPVWNAPENSVPEKYAPNMIHQMHAPENSVPDNSAPEMSGPNLIPP